MLNKVCSVVAAAALFACGGCMKGKAMNAQSFTNPVFEHGADPWVGFVDGKFYAAKTTGEGIELYCADTIGELSKSQPVRIFSGVEKTNYYRQFWAPEFFKFDGVWYCYFTACDGDIKNHKMFALRNRTNNLLANWEFAGALTDEKDGWCIDGTVFSHKNRRYLVYAHQPEMGEELVIRELITPEKLGDARAVISHPRPEEKWINEGPVQLNNGKHNLLVFTTHQSNNDDYRLTYLELVGDDPMKPECWKRQEQAFMVKSTTEFGPGHGTFFTDDAGDTFVAMQTIPTSGGGWPARAVWVQKLQWDANGYPAVQHPVRIGVPQSEPRFDKK